MFNTFFLYNHALNIAGLYPFSKINSALIPDIELICLGIGNIEKSISGKRDCIITNCCVNDPEPNMLLVNALKIILRTLTL